MDYDALARQFGGQEDAAPDYASLASQFGGQVEDQPEPQQQAPRFDAVEQPTALDDFLVKFGNTAIGKQLSGAFGGNMRGSAVGRVMQGMADPGAAAVQIGANLVGQGDPVNQRIADVERQYQASRQAAGSEGFDPLRMAGNIAMTAPIAGAASVPASLTGRIGMGAAQGAGFAALQPVTEGDFATEKGKQIGTGAVIGGVMAPVVGAVGRLISPKASVNPDVMALQQAGVHPTIGQALGGHAARIEEKMQSLPIMGDAITAAHGRGVEQLNKAVLNRAIAPIGGKVTATGQEGLQQVRQQLSNAYDNLLPKMSANTLDNNFVSNVSNLRGMVGSLPAKEAKMFDDVIVREIEGRLAPNGVLSANNLKKAQEAIREKAITFSKSQDGYQAELGRAFRQLGDELKTLVERSNPQYAKELNAINKGWSVYERAKLAAGYANAEKFSPAQLQRAVKAQDITKKKTAFTEGRAPLQDLSDAAVRVMKNRTPDSGTATRLMYGGGALASGMIHPGIPLGVGAGALAYTPALQNLLVGAVTKRPQQAQRLADLLRQSQPYLAAGAVPAYLND